jgi:hypothetical protein
MYSFIQDIQQNLKLLILLNSDRKNDGKVEQIETGEK